MIFFVVLAILKNVCFSIIIWQPYEPVAVNTERAKINLDCLKYALTTAT